MSAIVEQIVEPKAIAQGSDPQRISTVVKALVRVAEAWSLSNAQAASLFDVPTATWSRMKAGSFKGNLDQDKMDLSRNCSAPLTWYFATKERHDDIETNPGIPRRSGARSVDKRATA
ncbi:MAG: antitoxin Xre-like helix-turn-helix domain-containing protein [Maricaulaceae bacterium]